MRPLLLGFSLTGATIAAGEGVLVVLDVTGSMAMLVWTDVIVSDSSGEFTGCKRLRIVQPSLEAGDDCPSGNYDCAGVCDGDAEEDCAGDCGGVCRS